MLPFEIRLTADADINITVHLAEVIIGYICWFDRPRSHERCSLQFPTATGFPGLVIVR